MMYQYRVGAGQVHVLIDLLRAHRCFPFFKVVFFCLLTLKKETSLKE